MEKKIISGYPLIINYLGIFSFITGFIILTPLTIYMFTTNDIHLAIYFLIPSGISILIGLFVIFLFKGREKVKLERNQDAVLVVSVWLLAILLSSIPFILLGYTFTQSIFEVTSGYSTTGFTIVDVEQVPHVFLLYRSLLQFFGGVGLVLVLTSAISDKFGMRLYTAEGHSDKLMPNLIRSARMILTIYIGYIIVGTIAYTFFGMSWFDAVNHSISAVATGGFSTKAASIGHFNSLGVEIISLVLMILGGTNFFIHLMLIRGKFKNVVHHIEIKFLGILALIFIPLFIFSLIQVNQDTFGQALRVGIYHFFTTITTTGLHIVPSVKLLPPTIIFVTFILMMIGAGIGSTAGGMKLYRVSLSLKTVYWDIKDTLSHTKTIRTRFISKLGNKVMVERDDALQNYRFLSVYLIILFIGITIFTLYGYELEDSIFEFTSILGTIGLSVGIIQASAPIGILWTGIIGMLFARLESSIIIIAISKLLTDIAKRKRH